MVRHLFEYGYAYGPINFKNLFAPISTSCLSENWTQSNENLRDQAQPMRRIFGLGAIKVSIRSLPEHSRARSDPGN